MGVTLKTLAKNLSTQNTAALRRFQSWLLVLLTRAIVLCISKFNISILIFVPCFIQLKFRFCNASADTKYCLNAIFASIGLLGTFIASAITCRGGIRVHIGDDRSRAKLRLGLGFFFQCAIEFGFYYGMETGLILYGIMLWWRTYPCKTYAIYIILSRCFDCRLEIDGGCGQKWCVLVLSSI